MSSDHIGQTVKKRELTIGILALQGDAREHADALRLLGVRPVLVRRPAELEGLDGLIIPGGESTTMSRLANVFDLLEPLRKYVHSGLPTFGSCAGMVMLANELADGVPGQQTIGGLDIVVRRNAFGRQVESFEAPVTWQDKATDPLHGVFIRAPWVDSAGEQVAVIGTVQGSDGTSRIVAVQQGHLLATSFHPELTADDLRVHQLFINMVEGQQ